jgi:GNAT superfamily N-acetyltransferase
MDIVIRQAVEADAPELARLRWRWRVVERGEDADLDLDSFVEFFARWVVDHMDTHLPFVAEVDGRIAAMVWLVVSDRTPAPRLLDRRGGDIRSLYVIPEFRSTGVGPKLVSAMVEYARRAELIYLTVHSAANEIGNYLRAGFSDDGNWLSYPEERLRSVRRPTT